MCDQNLLTLDHKVKAENDRRDVGRPQVAMRRNSQLFYLFQLFLYFYFSSQTSKCA